MKPRKRSRRWWRSRRGISTVVANMMMIGITLSLGAILVAWAGQSYGAFSGGSQLFYQQRGQALQESFVIETVFFETNPPTRQIFVFVRNVGLININIVAIYVNGTSLTPVSGNVDMDHAHFPELLLSLGVGSVCEYSLNWPNSACPPQLLPVGYRQHLLHRRCFSERQPSGVHCEGPLMVRFLLFRFRRRRAVSTMIGGVIVLSLLLTALGTMVFVSQQYDQYQQTVNKMAQYRNQQLSEDIVVNSPGLTIVNSQLARLGERVWYHNSRPATMLHKQPRNSGSSDRKDLHKFHRTRRFRLLISPHIPTLHPAYSTHHLQSHPTPSTKQTQFLNPGETNHNLFLALPTVLAYQTRTLAFHRTQSSSLQVGETCSHFSGHFSLRFSVKVNQHSPRET